MNRSELVENLVQISIELNERIIDIEAGKLDSDSLNNAAQKALELQESIAVLKYLDSEPLNEVVEKEAVEEVIEDQIQKEIAVEEIAAEEQIDEEQLEEERVETQTGINFSFEPTIEKTEDEKEGKVAEVVSEAVEIAPVCEDREIQEETSEISMVATGTDINDIFKTVDGDLLKKLQDGRIDTLKESIDLNDKFRYIKDLFQGNSQVYSALIDSLDALGSYDEAKRLINSEIKEQYNWSKQNESVVEFVELVKRRYATEDA